MAISAQVADFLRAALTDRDQANPVLRRCDGRDESSTKVEVIHRRLIAGAGPQNWNVVVVQR